MRCLLPLSFYNGLEAVIHFAYVEDPTCTWYEYWSIFNVMQVLAHMRKQIRGIVASIFGHTICIHMIKFLPWLYMSSWMSTRHNVRTTSHNFWAWQSWCCDTWDLWGQRHLVIFVNRHQNLSIDTKIGPCHCGEEAVLRQYFEYL